jgi:hypothetical protein
MKKLAKAATILTYFWSALLIVGAGNIGLYNFYILLRWGTSALTFLYLVVILSSGLIIKHTLLVLVLIAITIIFNPIWPFHFEKTSWIFIDLITAFILWL